MVHISALKEQQRLFYKSIISVKCPILNNPVHFTSEGFNHLLYESNRKPRTIDEQYLKLKCLEYAPEVIKKCALVSETRQLEKRIKGKLKSVTHYELIHEVLPGKQIRVIVEKVGTGKYKFLSVMPHKRKTKKRP